jgi:acyl-CoA synthetase (NDP forming)
MTTRGLANANDISTNAQGIDMKANRHPLARTLNPRSVAIVGVSEESQFAAAALQTLQSDCEILFVHPKYDRLFGQKSYPTITAIGRPVDSIFTAVSAERTVDLVDQAIAAGCGGLITIAGGFSEVGAEGAKLQERMHNAAAAAGFPVVGPNGVGVINSPRRLSLSMLPAFTRRVGGVSAVAHSGALLGALGAAANRSGGIGFNLLISAGNEAVTDIADYLDYLVNDPETRIIALGIEKIRRPKEFFAAAKRARDAGKPIIAIKIGRSARGMRMAQSHTGTLTGDAWAYEVAFKQANIEIAHDVDEIVDRLQFLEQLPSSHWSAVKGLSVITVTGGFASMASDIAADEKIDVPEVERLSEWIGTVVPGATVPNPLDTTGFVGVRPDIWDTVLTTYAKVPEFDSYIFLSQFADWDQYARKLADPFAAVAKGSAHPYILSPLAGPAGAWMDEYRQQGVAVGNGLRGSFRGIQTMSRFVRSRASSYVHNPEEVPAASRPLATPIPVAEGLMLPFADTMELLRNAGIPIAPYHLIAADTPVTTPDFAGPYVVKLADVAHRTEHKAVRVNVPAAQLTEAVAEMRDIAARDDLPPLVAVQGMVKNFGEAFIGIQGQTELGPLVVFGLGGIFVEVLKRISGRLAPFSAEDAAEVIEEFTETGMIDGFRGQPAWDREQLAEILAASGRLAASARGWLASIDINPLMFGPDGFVAVDGLCLLSCPQTS